MRYEQNLSEYMNEIDGSFTEIVVHFNNSGRIMKNFEGESELSDIFILLNSSKQFENNLLNLTSSSILKKSIDSRDSLSVLIPITFIYAVIFMAGVLGNAITCLGEFFM